MLPVNIAGIVYAAVARRTRVRIPARAPISFSFGRAWDNYLRSFILKNSFVIIAMAKETI